MAQKTREDRNMLSLWFRARWEQRLAGPDTGAEATQEPVFNIGCGTLKTVKHSSPTTTNRSITSSTQTNKITQKFSKELLRKLLTNTNKMYLMPHYAPETPILLLKSDSAKTSHT